MSAFGVATVTTHGTRTASTTALRAPCARASTYRACPVTRCSTRDVGAGRNRTPAAYPVPAGCRGDTRHVRRRHLVCREVAAGQSDVTEGQTSHQAAVAHELTIPQLVDIESRTVEWVEPIRDVQVRQDPELVCIEGTIDLAGVVSMQAVYALLTAHERSADIFRAIKDVERIDCEDGSILLNQNCYWSFLVFSGSMPVSLRVREDPSQLTFYFSDESVSGFIQSMSGSWAVSPSHTIAGGVCVKYTMAVKMALLPPPPFGKYTQKIFFKQVTEILEDLQAELHASLHSRR